MLRKFSVKHYLFVSFSVAALALLGEAVCALCHGGSIRAADQNTTNALVIAPARVAPRSPRR